jgi:hypothetical protein
VKTLNSSGLKDLPLGYTKHKLNEIKHSQAPSLNKFAITNILQNKKLIGIQPKQLTK